MSALAILKEADQCGVRVALNGENLALKAGTKPPADLLAKLRAHKSEVVALLRKEASVTSLSQPDDVDLDERAAIAIDSGVPPAYADAWGRLQIQKPMRVSDAEWRQAIDAAGRFLDQWGNLAVDFQWTAGDLFDVPGNGKPSGLIWFVTNEKVRSLGPEYAVTDGGRVFERAATPKPSQAVDSSAG